jgi:glycerate 2-kinase
MKILICPDKFKGTLNALAVAEAIAKGWRKVRANDQLELLPMSDGGDGFGPVLGWLLGAKVQQVRTMDAAHRPCLAQWWWEPRTQTAILESAQAIGLARLPAGQFHPFDLDTQGVGLLFQAAAKRRPRRYLIGIGGSATNDGGFGLARSFGWQFLTNTGQPIEQWTQLANLATIVPPAKSEWRSQVIVAVDVQNPLLGARGASRIYGPQKGLRPEDIPIAEANLRRLRQVMARQLSRDYSRKPGTGAAGGLGFGLASFLGAKLEPGFDLFARYARLRGRLRSFDLVITGEGAIDKSSTMGKGVGEIARLCRQHRIPCLGIAGRLDHLRLVKGFFTRLYSLVPDMASPEAACQEAALWLVKLSELAAAECNGKS